jgi:hypothetical protein
VGVGRNTWKPMPPTLITAAVALKDSTFPRKLDII